MNIANIALFVLLFSILSSAQNLPMRSQDSSLVPTPTVSPTPQQQPSLDKQFFRDILHDQKKIWTSPFRVRSKDAKWSVPLAIGFATLVATDRRTLSFVDRAGSLPIASRYVSNGGAYGAGGIAAGFYLVGKLTKNRKAQETGLLAAESLIDAGIVTQALKLITQRQRPNDDAGRGRFFTRGNSFPSGHAASVWAVATIVAYEYHDHPIVRYGAFAAATAVSLSRYSGRKHFLSDILVGSAIGFSIGRFVYRTHHIQDDNDNKVSETTKLMPIVVPFYNPQQRLYGGKLIWNF